jgi:hypothetical protein
MVQDALPRLAHQGDRPDLQAPAARSDERWERPRRIGGNDRQTAAIPNVFCDNCRKVQPMIFDVLEADEKNTQAAADIVCAECKSIMATLYASNTDPN